MDANADHYIRLQEQMESTRGVWEGHWREVAERVRPSQNLFQQRIRTEGQKLNERMFDDTAQLALPKFAAAVISMTMPPTQTYHKLQPAEPALKKSDKVKRYLDAVNDLLFRVRYAPRANFQAQTGEVVLDIGAFGTGVLFIDDVLGIGIRYKAFPLAESYIQEDGHGRVDTLHRKFQLSAHQAATMFGRERLPEPIRQALGLNPLTKFWFLHTVGPNPDKKTGRADFTGMAFRSCYIAMEQRTTIEEGGFRTFPFCVPRFETAPRESYGRGPAMKVLPTIKALNEMKKTVIRAAQMAVAPPIMLSDDASLQAFSVRSNALNHGYVDNNGRPMAVPFNSGARVDIGIDLMNAEREAINDAFFVTLFRILVEEPQITATEAMLRAQEKGQLLAPTMGRIQAELLGPCVEREVDILAMSGTLEAVCGPMPPELIEAGGEFKLEYQSPLNQAQRAGVGVAIMNTLSAMGPLAQLDPTINKLPDAHAILRELAEINGMPARLLHPEDEVVAAAEAEAQQAQAQQMLAAAPVAASAAKDFAQAASMAGSAPGQAAPQIIPAGAA